mgnify:CR=1 FL=1
MLNFCRNILIISIILLTNRVYGLNSSSYLVANIAINLFEFDRAKGEFDQLGQNLNESDLHNQLFTYVNLNLLSEANSVAKKIIAINDHNQEAWIVHLANAIIKKDSITFDIFKKNQDKSAFNLLNYIFFSNSGNIKNNKLVARSIFEVVQASESENNNQISYKFLLFYLSIAMMLDPSFTEAYFYSAQIYQKLENYSKAEFFYNLIPFNHILFVDSQKNIAINKSKLGLPDDGAKLLKNLLDNNNQNLSIIVALADFYRVQKNYNEAIKYYTKIINLKNNTFKEYWKTYYFRGICFERLKKWDLAEKDFLYSLKIKSNSPEVLNYLAYGWLERDIYLDKAMSMLKEAYQVNPESFYIADSLAWGFYKKNELKKAVNLMEKVIVMAPGEAISLDHLGDIYFAMNRKREASYFWKQALDLAEPEDEISNKLIKKLKVYNAG